MVNSSADDPNEVLPLLQNLRQSLITKIKGKTRLAAFLPQSSRHAVLQTVSETRHPQENEPGNATLLVFDTPYPPCLKPLNELIPISIVELALETHHTDRVLFARRVGPSTSDHGSALYAVEDDTGIEQLIVHFLAYPDELFLPTDARIAIKQPYLEISIDKTPQLSVSHPGDIVLLSPDSTPLESPNGMLADVTTHGEAGSEARVAEHKNGHFDFNRLVDNMRSGSRVPRLEAESFLKRTEVRTTKKCGRGLFAKEVIKSGELVLVEKSFCSMFANEPGSFSTIRYELSKGSIHPASRGAFFKAVILKLMQYPSLIPTFTTLHADVPNQGFIWSKPIGLDGRPVLDYFYIERATALNSFGCRVPTYPGEKPYPFGRAYSGEAIESSGIWTRASSINHSCIPNAGPSILGDLLVLHAFRDIEAGEEITISYFTDIDYQTRTSKLKQSWGFDCKCPLCIAEAKTPSEQMEERIYLRDLITEQEMDTSPIDGAIEAVEDNIIDIEDTYDRDLYADLPRQDLSKAYVLLHQLHRREGNKVEAATALVKALEAMNIKFGKNFKLLQSRRAVNEDTVTCLILLAECHETHYKKTLRDLAEKFYLMLNGTLHGFDTICI